MSHTLDFRLYKLEQQIESQEKTNQNLSATNVWEWIQKYRPNIGEDIRKFVLIPFWKAFYLDPHNRKGALCGRQVYKSTAATDYLAYTSTTGSFRNAMYVIHDPTSMESFSTERVRLQTFQANTQLASFLPYGKRAAVKTINLTNNSRITFRHSQNHYANVEGQTANIAVIDEIQKQNLSKFRVLKHTIRAKNAPLIMFGIGAEEGTSFHDLLMKESDIYDWKYTDTSDFTDDTTGKVWPNQGWRHNLTFDEYGKITNTNQELEKILDGKLIQIHSAINDPIYKFYHFPQEIFASIPLTISDSKRYKVDIDQSVEYQQIHESEDIFQAHCMGWFHAARGRPLTLNMIRECYDDHISFLTPNEIKVLKEQLPLTPNTKSSKQGVLTLFGHPIFAPVKARPVNPACTRQRRAFSTSGSSGIAYRSKRGELPG